jgi:hypothetical protein
MSLAARVAASRKAAAKEVENDPNLKAEKMKRDLENRQIAKRIMEARRARDEAFPSDEIPSLTELAYKVVAGSFHRYPELKGIKNEHVCNEIVKLVDIRLPLTTTAKNIDQEFYWEEKCEKQLTNVKKEMHGNSFKQAFIERRI